MSGGGRTLTYTIDNISTHLHVNSRKIKWRGVARTHISEGVVYFVLSLRGGAGGREVSWNIFYLWSGTKPQLLFSETKQAGLRASCLSLSLSLVSQRARSKTLHISGQASFQRETIWFLRLRKKKDHLHDCRRLKLRIEAKWINFMCFASKKLDVKRMSSEENPVACFNWRTFWTMFWIGNFGMKVSPVPDRVGV